MKISKTERKNIEKEVDKYIKSLVIKDDFGVVIDDGLRNNHDVLLGLYKQSFFLKLKTDKERLIAKLYFKDKLPYKAWREEIANTPGMLSQQMEDFQEKYDPNYAKKRKTPRGGNGA